MKNFHLNLLKLLVQRQSQTQKGFTLTELLVGVFISVIVIGAAGYGLLQMLNASGSNSDETKTRAEVNRAIDFISDEVRNAKRVWSSADTLAGSVPAGATVVLRLEMPDVNGDGNDDEIVYYTQAPNSTSVWLGPQVLYRLGPAFNGDGTYSAGVPTATALIDRLQEIDTPACDTGTLSPTPVSGKVPGFYVCLDNAVDVDDDGTNDAWETAQLLFNGIFNSDDTDTYTADSKVTARLNDDIFVGAATPDTSDPSSGTTSNCSVTNNQLSCSSDTIITMRSLGTSYSCNHLNNTDWEIETTLKVGTPGADGMIPGWDTAPDVTLDEGSTSNPIKLPTGQSIQVTSDPFLSSGDESTCFSSSNTVHNTDTAQVEILDLNNKTFSTFPAFDPDEDGTPNQVDILNILNDADLVLKTYEESGVTKIYNNDDYRIENGVIQEKQDDGSYVDTTYTVDSDGYVVNNTTDGDGNAVTEYLLNVEKDQQFFLYLFEMGHVDPNAPANGFDQNDNVVLVTADEAAS